MSNMSYCRFENTARDLRDCVYALEEGELENGGTEMDAAIKMLDLCREYLDLEYKIDEIIEDDDDGESVFFTKNYEKI